MYWFRQTLPARDIENGQRRGSEPTDVVLASAAGPHLSVAGQQSRGHEYGDAGHAAGVQDTRRPHPTVGFVHSQR